MKKSGLRPALYKAVIDMYKTDMDLKKTIHFAIKFGESRFYAESLDLPVVTPGKTLDETIGNLREAVALHLEGEDLAELGLAADPVIVITYEAHVIGAA